MGFIARNLKNPLRSFTYIPVRLRENDELVVEIEKNKNKAELGVPYEFLLNYNGKARKVVGIPTKRILNRLIVKITEQEKGENRFLRLNVDDLNLKVELIPSEGKRLEGQLLDFSLGGAHIRLSDKDYIEAKRLFGNNPIWELLIHLDNESVKINGVPYGFNDDDKTILFVFSHNPDNYIIVDIYEELVNYPSTLVKSFLLQRGRYALSTGVSSGRSNPTARLALTSA